MKKHKFSNLIASERKLVEEALREKDKYAQNIIATIREPLIILDKNLRVVSAGKSFYTTFKVNPEETEGQLLYDLGNRQWDIPTLRTLLEEVLPEKKNIEDYEIEHDFEDIGKKFMLLNARKIIRENEEELILLAIEDITERKQAEVISKEAREYAQNIIATIREPLIILDKNLRVVSAGKSFYTTFKVNPEETEGQLLYDLGNRQWDIPLLRTLLEEVLPEKKNIEDYEIEHDFEDIGKKFMLLNARKIIRENEEELILLAIEDITERKLAEDITERKLAEDITERKLAEEALRESEERFREITENAPVLINSFDEEGRCLFWNEQCRKTFGWTIDELNAHGVAMELFYPDPAVCKEVIRTVTSDPDGSFREWHPVTKGGKILSIMWANFSLLNGQVFSMGHDITERKQAEQNLQENQKRYKKAQAMGHVGNWEYDPLTTMFWASDEAKRIYGLDPGVKDFTTEDVENCIPEREQVHQALIGLIEHYKKYDLVFDILTADKGIRKTIHSIAEVDRDVQGNPLKITGVVSDITASKQAERVIKESGERLNLIINTSPIGICTVDPLGNFLMTNPAYEQILGYSKEELVGLSFFDVTHPDDRPKNKKLFQSMFSLKATGFSMNKRYVRKDGSVIDVAVHAVGVKDVEGNVGFGTAFVDDITDRKRAEEKERIHHGNIDLLSKTAMRFIEFTEESNIYDFVGEQISEFVGKDSYIIVNSVDWKTGTSTIHSIFGASKYKKAIIDKLGMDPVGMKFNVKDTNVHYEDGKLHVYHDGLYGLLLNTVPKIICKSIEKLTKIKKIYVIDLAKKEKFFGSVIILLKGKTGELKNKQVIETFLKQASIAILKNQAEKALRESEATIRNKLKAITDPEGDIGALELSDIIDIEVLQSMMENFYQLTGMLGAVLELSGKVLVAVGWQDICTKFHRCNPDSLKNCIESDIVLSQGVPEGTFKAYKCKNNMWDIVTPIMVGGRHVGNVFMGQYLLQDEKADVELFRKQAQKYGYDEKEYLAALERVPRFSKETVAEGMQFYSKLARVISTLSYSTIQQSRMLAEQKQAEQALRESEAKLKALFSSLTETVVMHELVLNEKGEAINYRIIDCNKVFTEVTGIRKEDAIGKLASEVYQADPLPYLEKFAKVGLGGGPLEFTDYYPPLDKHLMISVVSPQPGKFATITTDITPMMQIQETIMAKNKEMESYLYITSHDLRTPLVNIQGFSQRLEKQTDSIKKLFADKIVEPELLHQLGNITDEDIPKTLSFILSNTEKMGTLINSLLQLSRTGRVEMNIQKIDMNELLAKVFQRLDFQIKEAQCEINIDFLPACYGDVTLLDQLFVNIISNALKYSDSERALKITVGAKKMPNSVVYTIRDTGKGIAQKYLEKIWDVFYRSDPRSEKAGEGIGLSLVKRIVEKHKGKVWVESEENRGSEFHIELHSSSFTEL